MKWIETMKFIVVIFASLFSFVPFAFSQTIEIKKRQQAMQVVKEQIGTMAPMAFGKVEYDDFLAITALEDLLAAVQSYKELFELPPTEDDKTDASPEIWLNKSDFEKKSDKFVSDILMAIESEPDNSAEFREYFGKITSNCKSCHQAYRIK
tara:strand:+ start:129 stop:581 length:453 start_codon:yes stop_codon:yes gene_type:complete